MNISSSQRMEIVMKMNFAMLLVMFRIGGILDANAQSTFFFFNYVRSGSPYNAPIYDAAGNLLGGTGYRAELYGGATSYSLLPLFGWESTMRVIRTFGTGKGAGYITSGATMNVDSVGPGGRAYLQIKAWDASLGSTYEEAAAQGLGGYGESNMLYLYGGDPTGVPPGVPTKLEGLQSFSLLPVPEPSTTVLALLGGGIMFWFMRKKASVKCSANPIPKWS